MKQFTKSLISLLQTIILSVLLALFVRSYIAEARWIPSESMLPTLKVGDHLIIDKVSYKLKDIQRGDIVVFEAPPSAHKDDEALIKRVIGLPGETVEVKEGTVFINGSPIKENYIEEKPINDFPAYTVPDHEVFVMGDNRNNSYDSRYWGPLPIQNIIGKAVLRYYPLGNFMLDR